MKRPENTVTLPAGYVETDAIDLQKDKKKAAAINVVAAAVMAAMTIPALIIKRSELAALFEGNGIIIHLLILIVSALVYIVGHEAVHAVFFKIFCPKAKLKCGFTLLYAFMAGDAYYNKPCYIVIGLAPIIVFGILFTALLFLLPEYFFVIWLLQSMNVSGAAGDIYVSVKLAKGPYDLLVYDRGVSMSVFYK